MDWNNLNVATFSGIDTFNKKVGRNWEKADRGWHVKGLVCGEYTHCSFGAVVVMTEACEFLSLYRMPGEHLWIQVKLGKSYEQAQTALEKKLKDLGFLNEYGEVA